MCKSVIKGVGIDSPQGAEHGWMGSRTDLLCLHSWPSLLPRVQGLLQPMEKAWVSLLSFWGSLGSYKVMVTDSGPGLIPALPASSHVTLGKGLLGLSLCICEMEINQGTSRGTGGRSWRQGLAQVSAWPRLPLRTLPSIRPAVLVALMGICRAWTFSSHVAPWLRRSTRQPTPRMPGKGPGAKRARDTSGRTVRHVKRYWHHSQALDMSSLIQRSLQSTKGPGEQGKIQMPWWRIP